MIEELESSSAASSLCPVNSYNEWDPLEEVIVGRLDGANIPSYHVSAAYNVPKATRPFFRMAAGWRYPGWMLRAAQRELDQFIRILEAEGVRVRQPEPFDFHASFRTPYWKSRGWCAACPRDLFMVVGDDLIETAGSWRSRFFEAYAYRPLFKEYFHQGARWTSAPKPELRDELYERGFRIPEKGEPMRYLINETEPVFDAADFVRCGRDLFYTRSNVTNESGVAWLRRHLGREYRLHAIPSRCTEPMHIDTTFMPLAPGKVLVNPEFCDVRRLPPVLKSWDVLVAPEPDPFGTANTRVSTVSRWCSINVLMLDEERVIVHESQVTLSKALKAWGFKPIPCSFHNYRPFGGSFHCATLDVRRRGTLQSYF